MRGDGLGAWRCGREWCGVTNERWAMALVCSGRVCVWVNVKWDGLADCGGIGWGVAHWAMKESMVGKGGDAGRLTLVILLKK